MHSSHKVWGTKERVSSEYGCNEWRKNKSCTNLRVWACVRVWKHACPLFAYLTHYQFWLQSFPVHWVRYQSCDLPGGRRWKTCCSCITWAYAVAGFSAAAFNAFQLHSRQPDHLNQQTHSGPFHWLAAALLSLVFHRAFPPFLLLLLFCSLFSMFPFLSCSLALRLFLFSVWSVARGASALSCVLCGSLEGQRRGNINSRDVWPPT